MIRVTVPLRVKPGPTKPAIQISDADRKRKILITDKCTRPWPVRNGGKKASPSGEIGTGALKVARDFQSLVTARSLLTQLTENPERA